MTSGFDGLSFVGYRITSTHAVVNLHGVVAGVREHHVLYDDVIKARGGTDVQRDANPALSRRLFACRLPR